MTATDFESSYQQTEKNMSSVIGIDELEMSPSLPSSKSSSALIAVSTPEIENIVENESNPAEDQGYNIFRMFRNPLLNQSTNTFRYALVENSLPEVTITFIVIHTEQNMYQSIDVTLYLIKSNKSYIL